ncbi:MAG: lamin tail domain-containing protein, partial [Clostridia bacterium]|nr:lamin tail domain-containing protein [Clostridia bacterium]
MQLKQLLKSISYIAMALLMAAMPLACDFVQLTNQAIGPSIVINEVVTSNGDSLEDEVYGSPDWIELKNVGSNPVSLLGYRITDNIQKADKAFILPDITLAPGEFLLLFATKEHETD